MGEGRVGEVDEGGPGRNSKENEAQHSLAGRVELWAHLLQRKRTITVFFVRIFTYAPKRGKMKGRYSIALAVGLRPARHALAGARGKARCKKKEVVHEDYR